MRNLLENKVCTNSTDSQQHYGIWKDAYVIDVVVGKHLCTVLLHCMSFFFLGCYHDAVSFFF